MAPEQVLPTLGDACVHADLHLLVFNKPAGLLTVPGRGPDKQDCLSARAKTQWPDALVVHRLDMATSGLLAMARGLAAQQRLSAAFEAREVHKRYVALVSGSLVNPLPHNGWNTIDLPLWPDWPNRPRSAVNHTQGKPSRTRWRLAEPQPHDPNNATRLELEPITGRSHQLRVHLLSIGHAILGDALYAPAHIAEQMPRLMLHAQVLELPHPLHGTRMRFEAPCPF